MYQEVSRSPSDPLEPVILPPSPSRDGSRASFWSDDSSYSISNSPSTSSITAGSLANSYICRLDEWAEGEDPIEDAPPSYRAAGQGCDADVPPPSTSPHPHPCYSQSSSCSVQRSAVPSNSLPPDAASPKVENGPRTSGVFSSDASSQVTISTPSPLIDCFPAALLSGLVQHTSIYRRAASLDSPIALKHSVTYPFPFASSAGVTTDAPSPTSSSASPYSPSPSTSSITSSAALCGRLVMASSVMNSRHRHPFTYCPSSPSSVSSSVRLTRRSSRSSTITMQPNCSSVSEKELRRRRLLKLTKTLGEEVPPELVVGTVGPREGLSRRAFERTLSGAPAIEKSYVDPRRQTHKKATSSILFPTYDGSNSLLNALLSTSSSRSNTGYVNSLDREDVAKRQHAGWGGGVGSGFGSLARHCREKHRHSKGGRDGKVLRGDDADDPEKRHSIIKPGTLLHPRPVLVPSASHDGASVGFGKSGRKARGALLDVMVESTSREEVVAYFEDHPFRVGDEGTGSIRDSGSPAITPLPSQPVSGPVAEVPAPSTPTIPATPLLHRSVASLRPPSHLSTPSPSRSMSNKARDSTRIHREEIPWMRHSMSLSPSLPSLSALASPFKHGEEAAPFSDYSPPSPLPTVGYRFPSPAIPESPSQVIHSTSKDSGKAAETKSKATTTKKVRIDLPIDHCSSTNGSMLDLSVDHPSGPLDVEAETYLDLSPDGASSSGLHSLGEGGNPVNEHGQLLESSEAVVSPASQATDGEAGAGKGEDPEAGARGVDVPEAGVMIVVDRCGSPIPRSESAMSGVYRSEKRQGWSGEWNQPHILDVIEKLRNL